MLSSASNLTKKAVNFFFHQNYIKKASGNYIDFSIIEITSKTVREKHVDITSTKIMLQKSCKKVHGNNVGFQPSKLRQKKYVEATCIFRSAKLQRKSTWKLRGNFSKFSRIDVISTPNRRRFHEVCPLG